MTPETIVHSLLGATGLVSGVVALVARKGERVHRTAGTVFFAVMMATAATGAYLGIAGGDVFVGGAGIITLYMLATAWMAARRPEGEAGWFELIAMLIAATGSAAVAWVTYTGVQNGTAMLGGIPGYGFAIVAGTAALLDLSVILRRGLRGRQRISRHLWRMHAGLFVAVGSFFPGQMQFFPDFIREIRPFILLFIPPFSVVGLMLIWLTYVWLSKRFVPARAQ